MNDRKEVVAALNGVTVRNNAGALILDRACLELRRGQVTCLVGPSGSGKTTSGLLLLGLMPAGTHLTEGSVVFRGKALDLSRQDHYRSMRGTKLAIVFQDPYASLNPLRRCGPQAEDPLRFHRKSSAAAAKTRVLEQFKAMGFSDPERAYHSFPHQLSGGQRQRVLLALATVLEPEVLVADEPTASLDAESQQQIIALLQTLATDHGTSVLLISHDMELVQSVSNAVVEISHGSMRVVKGVVSRQAEQRRNVRLASGAPNLLEVRSLSKSYRVPETSRAGSHKLVLENVSLEACAGEMIGIFGPSGAGKTTLGRCIAGLESYDAGLVFLAGTEVKPLGLRPHDGRIQMIYQSPASSLNPAMRVARTVEEALQRAGVAPSRYEQETADLFRQIGLPESIAVRYPNSLSGGEKQRVAIARCLARRPLLIIADEPTAALDERNKHLVLELLRHISEAHRLAVILITHERSIALLYCDRAFELADHGLVNI